MKLDFVCWMLIAGATPLMIVAQENGVARRDGARATRKEAMAPDAHVRLPSLLESTAVTRTQLHGGALLGQLRCDSQGNLYARTYDGQLLTNYQALQAPVTKVTPAGIITGRFPITDAGPNLVSGDFFVGSDGEVYLTAWVPETKPLYLAAFSKDGRFKSKTRLRAEFEPYQVAVYRSGEILLSGLQYANSPFTAVFNSDGSLLRKISLPEDESIRAAAQSRDPAFVSRNAPWQGNLAVEYGDLAAASDGNMYLMRRTSPALIYAISSRGSVVRRLQVNPGHSDWLPVSMKSSGSKLAIAFHREESNETMVKVVDLRGKELDTYLVDQGLEDGLSCYSARAFTFTGIVEGVFFLYRAEAKSE